jgi:hypothetical protein
MHAAVAVNAHVIDAFVIGISFLGYWPQLLVTTAVAVEKLASEKSAKIKTRRKLHITFFQVAWTFSSSQFPRILRKRDFFNSHAICQQSGFVAREWLKGLSFRVGASRAERYSCAAS